MRIRKSPVGKIILIQLSKIQISFKKTLDFFYRKRNYILTYVTYTSIINYFYIKNIKSTYIDTFHSLNSTFSDTIKLFLNRKI